MTSVKKCRFLAAGAVLVLVAMSAQAETTIYRWVDNQGVVHMSDYPPEHGNYEVITMVNPATTATEAPADRPLVSPPSTPRQVDEARTRRDNPAAASPAPGADISTMSLAELDRRCDDARERVIAPLREAEIAKCKANRRNDPAWCERFNADFGDGGRTVGGAIRPRMFDNLPECVDALNERNRRPR